MWIVVQMYAIFGKVKFVKHIPAKGEKSDICKKNIREIDNNNWASDFVKCFHDIGMVWSSQI